MRKWGVSSARLGGTSASLLSSPGAFPPVGSSTLVRPSPSTGVGASSSRSAPAWPSEEGAAKASSLSVPSLPETRVTGGAPGAVPTAASSSPPSLASSAFSAVKAAHPPPPSLPGKAGVLSGVASELRFCCADASCLRRPPSVLRCLCLRFVWAWQARLRRALLSPKCQWRRASLSLRLFPVTAKKASLTFSPLLRHVGAFSCCVPTHSRPLPPPYIEQGQGQMAPLTFAVRGDFDCVFRDQRQRRRTGA